MGGSKGSLPIITTGDVNGIIEHQNAKELSGFSSMVCKAIKENISGVPYYKVTHGQNQQQNVPKNEQNKSLDHKTSYSSN